MNRNRIAPHSTGRTTAVGATAHEPHSCAGHDARHRHGPGCGHRAIRHSGHLDYVVGDHRHHVDGEHCDHHGRLGR